MVASPLLQQLINQLRCLPGVGPKSAQRMAYHLLTKNRSGGQALAHTLAQSMRDIQHCQHCRNFSEEVLCGLCKDPRRLPHLLCIVESAADLVAIEQTGYRGGYFVLMGHLSPIDGIGPQQLGLHVLEQRLKQNSDIKEVILATNPTVEGEATAHYLAQWLKPLQLKISRIAHGVPLGGELEYLDGNTLARALENRDAL